MKNPAILSHRLINQHIAQPREKTPQQVVAYMGAMQAQDYTACKWAVGLRQPGCKEAEIEQAINNGQILRTHILRPTWHLVAPADIRWMQQLTAPRVHAANAYVYRSEGLDAKIFKRSNDLIARILEGSNYLTRNEIAERLEKGKIPATGIRLACLMMYAELECIICNGPKIGKQFTYALLDERVPTTKEKLGYEEALAKLTERYFTSRWPATVKDFAWWSGLTQAEAKKGIAMLPDDFETRIIGDEEFFIKDTPPVKLSPANSSFLMPAFDEYGISYRDRSLIKSGEDTHHIITANGGSVSSIIINGEIAGKWKTVIKKNTTTVETELYRTLPKTKQHALAHAVKRYCSFIGCK